MLEGFSHYVTKDGIRRSRVEADTAFFYENTQVTQLKKIRVVFFDVQGEESSTLTAKRGTYRWQDGSMEANGNVVVVSPDGRRLATESLKYDNAANQISTNVHFTFDRGTEHLEGNSFRSDPDFKNVVTDRPRGTAGDGILLPGQDEAAVSAGTRSSSCRWSRGVAARRSGAGQPPPTPKPAPKPAAPNPRPEAAGRLPCLRASGAPSRSTTSTARAP